MVKLTQFTYLICSKMLSSSQHDIGSGQHPLCRPQPTLPYSVSTFGIVLPSKSQADSQI